MINTAKFLNVLRLFEHVAELNYSPIELKIKVRGNLLDELERLKDQINEVDLGEEIPE